MAVTSQSTAGGFLAGTLVWTDRGPQPIEQLKVDDRVLSRSERADKPAHHPLPRVPECAEQTIMSVRYCLPPPEDAVIHHLYVTDQHPLWVKGKGWTRAYLLEGGEELELQDGGRAYVLEVVPVFRTDRPGVGWMPEYSHSVDGFEIDFSDGKQWWLDDHDQRNFGTSMGRLLATVYELQIDGVDAYYVGELGVRARGGATDGCE